MTWVSQSEDADFKCSVVMHRGCEANRRLSFLTFLFIIHIQIHNHIHLYDYIFLLILELHYSL